MKRCTLPILIGALWMLTTQTGTARTEVMSGPCPDSAGKSWIIVLTIDDTTGHVTHREGISCGGNHWIDHCSIIPASWVPPGVTTCYNDLPEHRIGATTYACEPYDPCT